MRICVTSSGQRLLPRPRSQGCRAQQDAHGPLAGALSRSGARGLKGWGQRAKCPAGSHSSDGHAVPAQDSEWPGLCLPVAPATEPVSPGRTQTGPWGAARGLRGTGWGSGGIGRLRGTEWGPGGGEGGWGCRLGAHGHIRNPGQGSVSRGTGEWAAAPGASGSFQEEGRGWESWLEGGGAWGRGLGTGPGTGLSWPSGLLGFSSSQSHTKRRRPAQPSHAVTPSLQVSPPGSTPS